MADENRTFFVIADQECEVPLIWSFTMGERRLLWEYAELTQEDFLPLEGETEEETDARVAKLERHPGVMDTLMHVAYARANPKMSVQKVRDVISNVVFADAVENMVPEVEEDDADPPALTSTPEESSPRSLSTSESSPSVNGSISGSDSTSDSGEAEEILEVIGTTRSDTSSLESAPTT